MNNENKAKGGMIVLLIFLLICSGLGIAAFVMSLKGCGKDGFNNGARPPNDTYKNNIFFLEHGIKNDKEACNWCIDNCSSNDVYNYLYGKDYNKADFCTYYCTSNCFNVETPSSNSEHKA